jgi:antitoxin CcdA
MRIGDPYKLPRNQENGMAIAFNRKASRQATNLSVNSELLKAARASGVNLSAVLEEALAEKIAAVKRENWVKENAEAIAAYNDHVAERGVFSDGKRSF